MSSKKGKKGAKDPEALQKAAKKEGGKKGQDLAGLADLGGCCAFTVAMETCEGDPALLKVAMEGANKEVDEKADDRKGGAGKLGKMFLTAGDDLHILVHVPEEVASKITAKEWLEHVCSQIGGEVTGPAGDGMLAAVAKGDPKTERFPLKMRDTAINVSFAYLRKKGLVPEDDESDEVDFGALQDEAEISW